MDADGMTEVRTFFKPPRAPKRKEPSAASKRPGMSEEYLRAIRRMPSCLSGRTPCDPHHLRCGPAGKERGTGLRATDRWSIPLTRDEHDDVHKFGPKREFAYLFKRGINCLELANALWNAWQSSKHSDEALLKVLEAHRGR